MSASTEDLVRRLYAALAEGDRAALDELLDPGFEGRLSEGMPLGVGGLHRGAQAMLRDGWWAIGRAFDVRAQAAQWLPCGDGRLVVLGRYIGAARSTGAPLDAAFAHLWTSADGRLVGVEQVTDSVRWVEALGARSVEGARNGPETR